MTGPVDDARTVRAEYESEERFLARRLGTWAILVGPAAEDVALAAVAAARPGRVVDVGCGTGDITARLAAPAVVVGIDQSLRMATLTRGRGIAAVRAGIEGLPLAGASVDAVLANRVLYHLPDLDAGLAEIARVLRPGGRLVAVTYSGAHLAELFERAGVPSPIAATFCAETGGEALARHFAMVERHDVVGEARFERPGAVAGYLGAFGGFAAADLAAGAAAVPLPLVARYRLAVFVAG